MTLLIAIFGLIFNALVLFGTSDDSRLTYKLKNIAYRLKYEAKQQAKSTTASASTQGNGSFENTTEGLSNELPVGRINLSKDELMKIDISSGVMENMNKNDPKKFFFQIIIEKEGEGSVDPEALKATVNFYDTKKLERQSIYEASVDIKQGFAELNLVIKSKSDFLYGNSSDDADSNFTKVIIAKNESGQFIVKFANSMNDKWISKANFFESSKLEDLTGEWGGNFANKNALNLTINKIQNIFEGSALYKDDIGPCKILFKIFPSENSKYILISGNTNDHSYCISSFAMSLEMKDGILKGILHERRNDTALPISLNKL